MNRQPANDSRHRGISPAIVTLAFWRLRRTWGLLLITCVGMIAAVMLMCAVPLYTEIAMTAGLRDVLLSSPQNSNISVVSYSGRISGPLINDITTKLNSELHNNLGSYLNTPQFSLETPLLHIGSVNSRMLIGLIGAPMDAAPSHVDLLAGRLPKTTGNTMEVALTPENADLLHVHVGSSITVYLPFVNADQEVTAPVITLLVVGIFKLKQKDDVFWHGNSFQPYMPSDSGPSYFSGLASNQALLSSLTRICNEPTLQRQVWVFQGDAILSWYYDLNPTHIAINDIGTLLNGINKVEVDNSNNPDLQQSPYIDQTQTYQPSTTLEDYNDHIPIAQLPIMSLLLLMLGLILFFISMMATLLVERQTEALAILRSRGASSSQVFGSLGIQSIGLGLIALLVGPLLALPVARFITQHTLSSTEQDALTIISGNPLPVLLGLRWYALVAVGTVIMAMILAILHTMGIDVLGLRREAARSTRRPFWQRLYLDVAAVIIAVTGFSVSFYVTNARILDVRSALLLLSPLTLFGSVFLLIGGMLLLLRFFPLLLQSGVTLTRRRRGAAPLLALAQMARAPRQSVSMALLLALATAFSLFSLICIASQGQRIVDVAAYQSGADFSGTIPVKPGTAAQLADMIATYRHLPGVLSASYGYFAAPNATIGSASQTVTVDFKAIDADSFANTTIWTQQDSSQSLESLMRTLTDQRASAISRKVVPAIVDATTWNTLRLSLGANFALNFSSDGTSDLVNFIAVAEAEHIPSTINGTLPTILVDYQNFNTVYTERNGGAAEFLFSPNTMWLRTSDNPATLASIRQSLTQSDLRLDPLYDRRAMIETLSHEPLYLTLKGVLILGAITALLLALVGNLLASWLSVRSRLTHFTLLRALGATRDQITRTFTWEQCIIYATALLLSVILGGLFSTQVVPTLVFTSAIPGGVTSDVSKDAFYAAQNIPPIQVILPSSLGIAFGMLILISIVSIGMMVQVASRPSISQTLRLNED